MVSRVVKHLLTPTWWTRRRFPAAVMHNIETAIRESEARHAGEIRFVVEANLNFADLLRGVTARDRAIELFSQLQIWDTEHNSGVLIYLLLADHDVEIVADRGIHKRVGDAAWETICQQMEQEFRQQRFEAGVINGIFKISDLLYEHFPAPRHNVNELSDSAIIL